MSSKKIKLLEKKELLIDRVLLKYNQISLKKSELWVATSVLRGQKKHRIPTNFYRANNVKSFLKNVSIPFYLFSHYSYFPELDQSQRETKIKKRIKTKTKIKIKKMTLRKLRKNKIKEEIIKILEKKSKKVTKKVYKSLITNLIKKKNGPDLKFNDLLKQKQFLKKISNPLGWIKNKIKKTKVSRNQILKKTYKIILNQIIYKKNLVFWKLIETTKKDKFFTKLLNIDLSKINFMPDYSFAVATQESNKHCATNLFKWCILSPMQLFYLGFKNLRVLRKINSNISLKTEFDFIKKEQSNLIVEKEKEFLFRCCSHTKSFPRPFLTAKPLKKATEAHQLNFLLAKNCLAAYSFFYYFCCVAVCALVLPCKTNAFQSLRDLEVANQTTQNKKLIDYSPQSLSLLRNNESLKLKKLKLNYLVSLWILSSGLRSKPSKKKTKIINKFTKKLPDKIIQFFLTVLLRNKILKSKAFSQSYELRDFCYFYRFATQTALQPSVQVSNKKKVLKQRIDEILSKDKISNVNFSNLKMNHLKKELNFKKKIF